MPTCPGSYTPADYLEELRDAANNLIASNRTMATNTSQALPATSTVTQGGVDPGTGTVKVNDRIATITTAEIFAAVKRRSDFDTRLRGLTSTVAACLADYARNSVLNQGATLTPTDRRMPLPAALSQVHDGRVDTGTPLRSAGRNRHPDARGPRGREHAQRDAGLRRRRRLEVLHGRHLARRDGSRHLHGLHERIDAEHEELVASLARPSLLRDSPPTSRPRRPQAAARPAWVAACR